MIVKPPLGIFPTMNIAIGEVPVNYESMNRVELHLNENMHDMATIEMVGLPTRALTDYINRPVNIDLSIGSARSQRFVGRVVEVNPTATSATGLVNYSPFQEAQVVCLGHSYEMRGSKSRAWAGGGSVALRDVVDEFSSTYGLSADIPRTPLVHNMLLQEAQSDWQFLVDLVKRLGYACTLHGTHLHVYDPYKALSRNASFARLLTLRKTRGDAEAYPGSIMEFVGNLAENHPDGRYKDTVITVNDGKTVYDVSSREILDISDRPRFTNRVIEYVDSYGEAIRLVEAANKEEYDFCAQAQVVGLLGTVPGGVVVVDSYDNKQFDGYWYVKGVKHTVTSGAFITDLEIARNKNSELKRTNTPSCRPAPAPVYDGSRWRSGRMGVDEY